MNAVLTPTGMTLQEYLDWESTQQEKHEYVGGQVYAMTGARLNHNRIALNAVRSLRQALPGRPCEADADALPAGGDRTPPCGTVLPQRPGPVGAASPGAGRLDPDG